MARTQVTDAIVLRSVDYRDADRIVTLLTGPLGKVAVMARGARRSKRRFSGSLEPFAIIRAEVALGRGEVGSFRGAQVIRAYPGILASLQRLALGGVALELVRKMVPDRQPDARVFGTVVTFLDSLDGLDAPGQPLLLAFQVRLMTLAGFAPAVDACGRCGRDVPEGKAALFEPSKGAVVCRQCGGGPIKLSGAARRRVFDASACDWYDADWHWDETDVASIRSAVRGMLEHQVGIQISEIVSQVSDLDR